MKILEKKLTDIGLENKEARVYLAILELGEASIARVVEKSAIKRSTVYEMIDILKKKGLVSLVHKGKRTLYIGEDPRKIERHLDERKKTAQEIMPELLSYMNALDRKPKIRYFEGVEGIKEVFRDTLEFPGEEVLTWFPYRYINLGEEFFSKYYFTERLKKRISVRAIVPDTQDNRSFAKFMSEKVITQTRFVSDGSFKMMDIEIKIYGRSRVGIASYKENLGLIIESKDIYLGLKSIFEALWNILPEK